MRTTFLTVGALALSLFGTGCVATHKYVAKTIAPVTAIYPRWQLVPGDAGLGGKGSYSSSLPAALKRLTLGVRAVFCWVSAGIFASVGVFGMM